MSTEGTALWQFRLHMAVILLLDNSLFLTKELITKTPSIHTTLLHTHTLLHCSSKSTQHLICKYKCIQICHEINCLEAESNLNFQILRSFLFYLHLSFCFKFPHYLRKVIKASLGPTNPTVALSTQFKVLTIAILGQEMFKISFDYLGVK